MYINMPKRVKFDNYVRAPGPCANVIHNLRHI